MDSWNNNNNVIYSGVDYVFQIDHDFYVFKKNRKPQFEDHYR